MKRLTTAFLVALLSCDAGGAYLYYGYRYEPSRDCLDQVSALDVFDGTDPGTSCAPKCIGGVDLVDGAAIVYATSMCGPPPPKSDISGTSPYCPGALAAQARGDFCLDGGGSTNPLDGSVNLDSGAD